MLLADIKMPYFWLTCLVETLNFCIEEVDRHVGPRVLIKAGGYFLCKEEEMDSLDQSPKNIEVYKALIKAQKKEDVPASLDDKGSYLGLGAFAFHQSPLMYDTMRRLKGLDVAARTYKSRTRFYPPKQDHIK